jgi:nucleoid-associated protein YgaU
MALTDKYRTLVDLATQLGATALDVQDSGDVLHVSGTVNSEDAKQKLWDEYGRLDPDMRAGDLVLDIKVEVPPEETYTVKGGDTLGKIARHYPGRTWQQIFEANRDQIDDADKIFPGQKLRIPNA